MDETAEPIVSRSIDKSEMISLLLQSVVGPERIRNKKAGHSAMNLLRTENKGASDE